MRLATANDHEALEGLGNARLGRATSGSTLVGELLQRPVAALSLSDGRVIADPFVATADVIALLRLRARQLGVSSLRGRRRRSASDPHRHSAKPGARQTPSIKPS